MVLKSITNLKKFRVKELKDLIKKHKIGKITGKKSDLISRISNSDKWKQIKEIENMPVRAKRKFT